MSKRRPYAPPPRPTLPDPCPECRSMPGLREMARHYTAPPAASAKPGSPGVPTIVIVVARCDCPRGALLSAYPLHSDVMTRWSLMPGDGHVFRTSAARPRLLDDERLLPAELARRVKLAIPPLRRGMHPEARPRPDDGRQAPLLGAVISSEPDIETTVDKRPHWTDHD